MQETENKTTVVKSSLPKAKQQFQVYIPNSHTPSQNFSCPKSPPGQTTENHPYSLEPTNITQSIQLYAFSFSALLFPWKPQWRRSRIFRGSRIFPCSFQTSDQTLMFSACAPTRHVCSLPLETVRIKFSSVALAFPPLSHLCKLKSCRY